MSAREHLKNIAIILKDGNVEKNKSAYNESMSALMGFDYPVLSYSIEKSKEYTRLVSKILYNQMCSQDSVDLDKDRILLNQTSLGQVIYEDFNINIEEEEFPLLKMLKNKEDIDYFCNLSVEDSPSYFIKNKIKTQKNSPTV